MIYWISLLCLLATTVQGAGFDNSFNQVGGEEIHSFHLMGERCSGTKFVETIINNNFNLNYSSQYGHKHFIPWIHPNYLHNRKSIILDSMGTESYYKDSDGCLFIVIVRDPYDWLRSFYQTPHHVHRTLTKSFTSFTHLQWLSTDPYTPVCVNDNYNPWTNRPFKNVLELRKYKYLNYLNVRHFVKNYLFVRYEDVRDDQAGFIEFLTNQYRLKPKGQIKLIHYYVNHNAQDVNKSFKKSKYFNIKSHHLKHINSKLDWVLENLMEYSEKTNKTLRTSQ